MRSEAKALIAWTMTSWARIPLKAWIFVLVFVCTVVLCIGLIIHPEESCRVCEQITKPHVWGGQVGWGPYQDCRATDDGDDDDDDDDDDDENQLFCPFADQLSLVVSLVWDISIFMPVQVWETANCICIYISRFLPSRVLAVDLPITRLYRYLTFHYGYRLATSVP
jgi:hypothetical protein